MAIGANPSGGTLAGTATVAAVSGVATFSGLSIDKAGTGYTLVASSSGLTDPTSTAFNITAGAATQLVFTGQPSNTAAGVAITPAVQVTARDGQGNTATGFTGNVTVAIGANPSGGTLAGTATVAAVSGVATFSGLSIDKAGTGYTLVASSSGLTDPTSTAFNITAGAATQLSIATQPSSSARSGVAFAQQPVLQVQDANGNSVSQSGTVVTATIASGPNGATLSNASATTESSGAATFSGLAISGPTASYTLNFGATGLASVVSGTISLTAGPAASIANNSPISQSAPAGTAVASPPSVIVRDASGNPVAGVEVTFATGINSGTVDPTTPIATGADGIATVTSWTLSPIAGPNTLTATPSPGTLTGSPVIFTATGTPGAPSSSRSSVTAAPSPITASNGASASTITVTVLDEFGNAVSGAPVTLSATGTGNALTPSGTTDGNGVMTGTLSSTGAGTKTITATVGSVTLGQKPTVTVDPASASRLVFTVQPSQVVIGNAIQPAVVVTALDPFQNIATSFASTVVMAIGNDASLLQNANLGGTTAVPATNGVATFPDLTIDQLGVGYTLTANSTGLIGDTSNPFTVLSLLP
ncbi:MAG: hypothetical protein DMD33_16090 [Gemmatimonadetes bacterium]|nr:MAG: hypothetical protein DMD33_16090 [Gemmatimonadota bacterium]